MLRITMMDPLIKRQLSSKALLKNQGKPWFETWLNNIIGHPRALFYDLKNSHDHHLHRNPPHSWGATLKPCQMVPIVFQPPAPIHLEPELSSGISENCFSATISWFVSQVRYDLGCFRCSIISTFASKDHDDDDKILGFVSASLSAHGATYNGAPDTILCRMKIIIIVLIIMDLICWVTMIICHRMIYSIRSS